MALAPACVLSTAYHVHGQMAIRVAAGGWDDAMKKCHGKEADKLGKEQNGAWTRSSSAQEKHPVLRRLSEANWLLGKWQLEQVTPGTEWVSLQFKSPEGCRVQPKRRTHAPVRWEAGQPDTDDRRGVLTAWAHAIFHVDIDTHEAKDSQHKHRGCKQVNNSSSGRHGVSEWRIDTHTHTHTLGEGDQRTKPRKRTVSVGENTRARH